MSRLTNTDFSRLLNQADKNVLAELTQPRSKKSAGGSSSAKERHKQRYLQIIKRQKHREKLQQQEGSKEASQWRDRAAERRNAVGDYARIAEEYQLLKDRTEDESKFLGGDEDHTHLVKGLDYRLLEKVRAEIEKKEDPDKKRKAVDARETQQERAPPEPAAVAAVKSPATALLTKRICHELIEQVHPHHTSFQKKLQRIESVALRGAHFRGNTKNFLPGKMIYQFDLSLNRQSAADATVPVIVFQSVAEPKQSSSSTVNAVVAPIHEKILSDLTAALDAAAQVKKRGKRLMGGGQRRDLTIDDPVVTSRDAKRDGTHDDSTDIFIGVGGFDPSEVKKEETNNNVKIDRDEDERHQHQYFAEIGGAEEQGSKQEQRLPDGGALLPAGLASKIEAVRKRGGEDVVEARSRNVVDDYNECYPDTNWIASEGENEKKKRKKGAGKRENDSDEGGERKKPRVSSRGLKRQSEREWQQIEKIIESKKARKRGLETLENEIQQQASSKGHSKLTVL